jgi:hypothetical protein
VSLFSRYVIAHAIGGLERSAHTQQRNDLNANDSVDRRNVPFSTHAVAMDVILTENRGNFKTDEKIGEKPYFLY